MSEMLITDLIYKYFDDIRETEIRQNIYRYMENNNISNKGILTTTKHKLKFLNQIGGEIYEIKLKDKKVFYYNIDDVESVGKTKYKLKFITFDNINECACLTFGKKENKNTILRIDGIKSFENCIICEDNKNEFKSGDILMQVILELVKNNQEFSHIDKIELADSSQKSCYDIGLKLIYLRTMTHGIPYYAKFGFRPVLKTQYDDVFVFNRNNFKLNKTMSKNDLLSIINKNKVNMSDATFNAYEKYIKKHILNNERINPVIFITQTIKIVDNSIAENKNNKIKIIEDKNELKGLCDFIRKIYIDVYKFLGYKTYDDNLWILNIKRNIQK